MKRRELLVGAIALGVSQSACGASGGTQVEILQGSVPPQVLSEFRRYAPSAIIQTRTVQTIAQAYQRLQTWGQGQGGTPPSWISLGDFWLAGAIEQSLIQPISLPPDLAPPWQALVTRDPTGLASPEGQPWAVPYRWGHLMALYDRTQFPTPPLETWADLWQPPWTGKLLLPDHPRLVDAIVLLSLGHSINTPNPTALPDFSRQRQALLAQARGYAQGRFVEPVIRGDVALSLGWSTDIRPVLATYGQLAALTPNPGTVLTADLWVQPQGAPSPPPPDPWLSYWGQPQILLPLSLLSQGLAPPLLTAEPPPDLRPEAILLPSLAQRQRSEFLLPLAQT